MKAAKRNEELKYREPFSGRWFGIRNVEGEGEPIALFPREREAEQELARRRALANDDDDHLTEFDHVFPCDIAGAWWNSYDPAPRPLTIEEIVRVAEGCGL